MSEKVCFYCNEKIHNSWFRKHLATVHQKSVEDYAIESAGLDKDNLPKCEICEVNPVRIEGFNVRKYCSNDGCKTKFLQDIHSKTATKTLLRLSSEGKNPLQKQNRPLTSDGRDLYTVNANTASVKNGTHHFLSKNRVLDEDGKDILAQKTMSTKRLHGTFNWSRQNVWKQKDMRGNPEEFADKQFLEEHFLSKDGEFDLYAMMQYFNCTYDGALKAKQEAGIEAINTNHWDKRHGEQSVNDFLVTLNIPFEGASRKLIKPYELDFYFEDHSLAIEYDGIYWHSNIDRDYHLNKTQQCEEKGVQLLHMLNNEWTDKSKRPIWESVIRSKLGLNKTIFARKCTVCKNIDVKGFLDENHLQGYIPAKITYGLMYQNQLVSVMTFSAPRFNKAFQYELIRFCNLRNINVIGGAGKLLKHFICDYHPKSIISYANRRWSNGRLYEKLGFTKIGESEPNYFYTKDCFKLLSRLQCQKHKLPELLGDLFDENLTEQENMLKAGYRILYDCGNLVYGMNLEREEQNHEN